MGKACHADVLDGSLDVLAAGNIMIACSAEPTSRAEAVSTYALADVAMVGGDYVKAAGDTSGRKSTVQPKSGVNVDSTGTANHVAVVDGTRLLYVTTCTSQALTAGNTVDFPAWDVEIADPV